MGMHLPVALWHNIPPQIFLACSKVFSLSKSLLRIKIWANPLIFGTKGANSQIVNIHKLEAFGCQSKIATSCFNFLMP